MGYTVQVISSCIKTRDVQHVHSESAKDPVWETWVPGSWAFPRDFNITCPHQNEHIAKCTAMKSSSHVHCNYFLAQCYLLFNL